MAPGRAVGILVLHGDILALLEDGPKSEAQLAAWLDTPELGTALQALAATGQITRVRMREWALASRVVSPAPPMPVDALDDVADDEGDDIDEDLASLDEEDAPRPIRMATKAGRVLRQPKAIPTPVAGGAPSWWTTAPRDGFTDHQQREHGDRMKKDLINRLITQRLLGGQLP